MKLYRFCEQLLNGGFFFRRQYAQALGDSGIEAASDVLEPVAHVARGARSPYRLLEYAFTPQSMPDRRRERSR